MDNISHVTTTFFYPVKVLTIEDVVAGITTTKQLDSSIFDIPAVREHWNKEIEIMKYNSVYEELPYGHGKVKEFIDDRPN